MKNKIVEVNRKNDRIIWIRLTVEGCAFSIFSVYAPQIGCPDEEKDRFWSDLQEEIEKVGVEERCIVGGDLNGHVGQNNDVISRIHGGYGYEEGNAEGERIIDFAVSSDMVIANTFFNKRREHLITYKSGGRACQIDFLLCRRKDLVEIKRLQGYTRRSCDCTASFGSDGPNYGSGTDKEREITGTKKNKMVPTERYRT